tara:strand:+ start:2511 stop:2747 length:237 start_codon:yes stop_codon:yes gene_type:complete
MTKIKKIGPDIVSIKPDTPAQIADDGTILNPLVVTYVDVFLDNNIVVQVERPISIEKINDKVKEQMRTVDGVKEGAIL